MAPIDAVLWGSSGIRDSALIGADMLQAALRSIVAWERRPAADCTREPVDSPLMSADNGGNPPTWRSLWFLGP
jgi:hypothetical protein